MTQNSSPALPSGRRGTTLLGTVLTQLGAGTAYVWSMFNSPLAGRFYGASAVQHNPNLTFSLAVTFSIMMFALSASTLSIGWLQAKFGVRKVVMACGVLLGVGFFVSAFASNVWVLYIFAGLVAGVGDGISYLLSLTNCLRWYPDKAGTVSGICVGAYGIPAILLPLVLQPILNGAGASTAMIVWAIIAAVLVIPGGLLLADAPIVKKSGVAATSGEYTVGQMLHTKQAYMLYIALIAAAFSGQYVIGNVGNATKIAVPALAVGVISMVSLVGFVNTIGRFALGWLSDRMKRTLLVGVVLAALAIFAFALGFSWVPPTWLFVVGFLLLGFGFGGTITIFPTIVGEFYGKNNQSKNYSVIYTGFAVAALITLVLNGLRVPFNVSFPIGGVVIAIGAVMMLIIRAPQSQVRAPQPQVRAPQSQKTPGHQPVL
jgi:OFA family oxalate/formate antiporter-like MFS transporter